MSLALAAALFALPAAANDLAAGAPAPTTKASTSQVSLRHVAAREASRTPLARPTGSRHAEQSSSPKESTRFFKTRAGAVALAVMVVGAGYAVYSTKHDRITSPAKK